MEDDLQTDWPDLQVFPTSTTWRGSVIGPLVHGIDRSSEAFHDMATRARSICGVPSHRVACGRSFATHVHGFLAEASFGACTVEGIAAR